MKYLSKRLRAAPRRSTRRSWWTSCRFRIYLSKAGSWLVPAYRARLESRLSTLESRWPVPPFASSRESRLTLSRSGAPARADSTLPAGPSSGPLGHPRGLPPAPASPRQPPPAPASPNKSAPCWRRVPRTIDTQKSKREDEATNWSAGPQEEEEEAVLVLLLLLLLLFLLFLLRLGLVVVVRGPQARQAAAPPTLQGAQGGGQAQARAGA